MGTAIGWQAKHIHYIMGKLIAHDMASCGLPTDDSYGPPPEAYLDWPFVEQVA